MKTLWHKIETNLKFKTKIYLKFVLGNEKKTVVMGLLYCYIFQYIRYAVVKKTCSEKDKGRLAWMEGLGQFQLCAYAFVLQNYFDGECEDMWVFVQCQI